MNPPTLSDGRAGSTGLWTLGDSGGELRPRAGTVAALASAVPYPHVAEPTIPPSLAIPGPLEKLYYGAST